MSVPEITNLFFFWSNYCKRMCVWRICIWETKVFVFNEYYRCTIGRRPKCTNTLSVITKKNVNGQISSQFSNYTYLPHHWRTVEVIKLIATTVAHGIVKHQFDVCV